MTHATPTTETNSALTRLDEAARTGKISAGAREHIRSWLTESRYRDYEAEVRRHIDDEKWEQLDNVFWTVIPFGTGGRRGRMYPIGCNAINDRTIGESAAGVAAYAKEHHEGPGELSCAIAYDTRHKSRHFAELCARIMVAAGYRVYFLDDYRSTPALSFLVRYKECSCGIMVTASHNPPSDNAVKIYWSTGGQVLPPHDKGIIERVMHTGDIELGEPFDAAVADGRVVICTEEIDRAYIAAVLQQSFSGPRDLKVLYSPLHGVGVSAAAAALAGDEFTDVEIFGPHAQPDGDFPNVPNHVSNPENPDVFDSIVERAREIRADLIIATDPDCDRLGCASPLTSDAAGPWTPLTGNQIAAMLAEFVFSESTSQGRLPPDGYMITTFVTTGILRRIAKHYGVRVYDQLHVGFKNIGGLMDKLGPEEFLFGCEESLGYLVGTHARDKDAGVASMLIAEFAAKLKAEGQSLYQKLETLWRQYGYFAERLDNQYMHGSEGMARMKSLMTAFRESPPDELGGLEVAAIRDYQGLLTCRPGHNPLPLDGPKGNMIMIDLAVDNNYVAVRPSGTEPKVKYYMFTSVPPEQVGNLADTRTQMEKRLDAMAADLAAFAERV